MPVRFYFQVVSVTAFISTVIAMTHGVGLTDAEFDDARELALWACRNVPGFETAHVEWIALLSIFRSMWRWLSPRPGR